ncbi:twin transmembrane helix small protein [Roseibium salinum]|uniref:Twin transmembrane helix small protein n=1 Tax=Roseibium salinum TaxID=1604349 RepID=A0ABT3R6T8_9HYPH|nr:twin transmembrane helix small protein [Roseibium sp. DSM 29163]MCX2724862.1 twin transmembrane helix small protein [Roseibium sp. DSM 29163]MDN3721190.1 twin transmembrane helix small protein [Roseibium salinum]
MGEFVNILIPIGLAAVALVLLLGILNMFRNGPGNRSQLLMRWRVGLQFLVIILVMGSLYFFGTR